jgi:Na+/proline symporter
MDHLSKRIEIAANLAILIVVALLGIVLIKNYLVTGRQEKTDPIHYGSSELKMPGFFYLTLTGGAMARRLSWQSQVSATSVPRAHHSIGNSPKTMAEHY